MTKSKNEIHQDIFGIVESIGQHIHYKEQDEDNVECGVAAYKAVFKVQREIRRSRPDRTRSTLKKSSAKKRKQDNQQDNTQ